MRTIVIFLFLNLHFLAQKKEDYIKYYNLCNQGAKYLHQGNYALAFEKYDSAFTQVHYQHVSNLLNAATSAIHLQNKKKATVFLRQAILNGLNTSALSRKEYLPLADFKKFKDLKDSLPILRQKFNSRVNKMYAKEIDSLYYVDQVVIRNVETVVPLYKIDLYVYAADRAKYDSISFQYLLSSIRKYGFPSEEKIGPESYEGAKLVIHHSARMPGNREYLEIFKSAVLKGEYRPEDYAWMYDQSRTNLNQDPFFYYHVGDPSKLSETEKTEINKRRKEYGLNSLDDDKIVKHR